MLHYYFITSILYQKYLTKNVVYIRLQMTVWLNWRDTICYSDHPHSRLIHRYRTSKLQLAYFSRDSRGARGCGALRCAARELRRSVARRGINI